MLYTQNGKTKGLYTRASDDSIVYASRQFDCCFIRYQSWAGDNFIASQQRQRDNVIELQGQIFSSSQVDCTIIFWIRYSINNDITKNVVAWNIGHFVAAVLSRAQLC